MYSLYLGIAAFLLFLLYDINSFTRNFRLPRAFFSVGILLIITASILDLLSAWKAGAFSGILDVLFLVVGALCFLALIYSLFFALPFQETYTQQKNDRAVCSNGVYALCRHPGVLFFWFMYFFLGLAALPHKLIINGMIFSTLNLLYAWFQDCVTFPKTFCDYRDYQKKVPFLIPTKASIRKAQKTLPHSHNEEDYS